MVAMSPDRWTTRCKGASFCINTVRTLELPAETRWPGIKLLSPSIPFLKIEVCVEPPLQQTYSTRLAANGLTRTDDAKVCGLRLQSLPLQILQP